VPACPVDAIRIDPNPSFACLGDSRWTHDLLSATFIQSETGRSPAGYQAATGGSEGGFDRLRWRMPPGLTTVNPDDVDLSLELNRRPEGRRVRIDMPIYGGGMSFGSVSLPIMLARAIAARELNTFTCTGEGGYPDELTPYADNVITQVATGLFGVREETIQRAPIIEFKYAQGAKPGLGGHLLSDKVTPGVASVREAVPWASLFSPFPFHSVYSVEDHKKHVDWIKTVNPDALISVKVATPEDVDMVAVGSYYAGANIIHLDGGYGGTGAAPEIAKKNIAMPIEFAIPKAHRFLQAEGIRHDVTLIASGGVRTPHDVAKIIALGADGVVVGTAELVAVECVRCGNCESGRGCPLGIATTDDELTPLIDAEWGARRIVNMYRAWMKDLRHLLAGLGLRSVAELRGRIDLLEYA
jgi:glutamate synthase domain-containing protein 2